MFFKLFQSKIAAVVLGFAAVSLGSAQALSPFPTATPGNQLIAKNGQQQFVTPAQIFLQDSATITPTLNRPIAFKTINIQENVKIEKGKTVFKIRQAGLYSIGAFLTVTAPNPGQTFTLGLLINGKSFANFRSSGTSSGGLDSSVVFAELYLKKGDKISIALLSAPAGTTLGARTLNMMNFNDSRN